MSRHMHLSFLALAGLLMAGPAARAQSERTFLGKTAEAWAAQLRGGADGAQRRAAAFALGTMGNRASDVLDALKQHLGAEKDPKVREAVVFALGEIGRGSIRASGDEALEKLVAGALKDEDPLVRRSAAYALGCLGNKSDTTRAALEAGLDDSRPEVRQNVAWALGQLGEESLPLLGRALTDEDAAVKRDAAKALLQMGDAEKVRGLLGDLVKLCRDADTEVRRAGVDVLSRVVGPEDKEAVPALLWALEDRNGEIRRSAAIALSNVGGREAARAVPVLLEALRLGDLDLRQRAAVALRGIGPDAAPAVPDLVKTLTGEDDAKLREYAALALGGVGPAAEKAAPALLAKLLDEKEPAPTRIECAKALAFIGTTPATTRALPDLLRALGNPRDDSLVRARLVWVLRRYGVELRSTTGAEAALTAVLREPRTPPNTMLRYDCAFMLGMIWQDKAPEVTLDVLLEFLRDESIKLVEGTSSQVTSGGNETVAGKAEVKELVSGDGRVMAAQALEMMGPPRYTQRPAIMQQLRALADDNRTAPDLRKHAAKLVKMGS